MVLAVMLLGCSTRKQTVSENDFAARAPQTQAAALNAEPDKGVTVYITKTGSKYHESYCRYLKNSKIETELERVRQTHQPCLVCVPPE
jgi:hypothetical protein